MVPARSRLFHHDSSKRSGGGNSSCCPQYCIAAKLEASAAGAAPTRRRNHHHQPPAARYPRILTMADDDAAGTSSRGGEDDDKDWLQLSLAAAPSSSSGDNDTTAPAVAPSSTPTELDMFATKQMRPRLFPLPVFRSYHQYGHGGRCRPTAAPAPSFFPFARPLRSAGDPSVRVISPPRRAEAAAAGLWLTLQAAPDQVREPILPQIPKSYLRIKDSNMKVEVVMKYLAGKLGHTQSHLQRAAPSSLLAGQKCQRQHLVLIDGTKLGRRRRRRGGSS
ncbi:hypothetical protein E2562_016676 [Oryza meyeriana var. granulata]|uniref:Uncharacterized protein n=1 Tax=Oryza meyeriana var. granulata TaxID=110450 RepID=A0A6G1EL50_9ORYZ|nr:hypothetical protein E2562_016676 [Oryza meyeriana var. granulata]